MPDKNIIRGKKYKYKFVDKLKFELIFSPKINTTKKIKVEIISVNNKEIETNALSALLFLDGIIANSNLPQAITQSGALNARIKAQSPKLSGE
jgi:hypothetical protein